MVGGSGRGLTQTLSNAIPRQIDAVASAFILYVQEKLLSHTRSYCIVSSHSPEAVYSGETLHNNNLAGFDLQLLASRLSSPFFAAAVSRGQLSWP